MSVVERILYLMEVNGVNAKKLTNDLDLSGSSITDWKKGKAHPSVEAIVKIAKYFKVTTDYLLYDDVLPLGAPSRICEEEVSLINLARELRKDGVEWEKIADRMLLTSEAVQIAERWSSLDDDGVYVVGNSLVQEERRMAAESDVEGAGGKDTKGA